jgi:tripartite-type tricarboxylate transporter receptor subunit TctC
MQATLRYLIAVVAFSLLGTASPGRAADTDAAADFYKGKTLSLVVGFPPGGGYDTYTRVLARHFGRFVPGHPSVIVSNMPGAGSLLSANFTYNKAAPDGLFLAMFASAAAMESLLGNKAAAFDMMKFSWIGSLSQDVIYCGVWQRPGVATTFEQMMDAETIFGSTSPDAITYQHPMILKNVLNARIRLISGYPGTREINAAMQRAEVNGVCGMPGSSVKSVFPAELKDGRVKLVIQMGSRRSSEFGNVPSVFDFAKSDADRAIMNFHFGQLLLGRPVVGPPGIPADRLAALRSALLATAQDPQFLEDAKRAGLDVDPATAEEVMAMLRQISSYPPDLLAKAKEAVDR